MKNQTDTTALSHNPELFKRTFWLHMNPDPSKGFGQIWKTRTEPVYSKSKKGYTFTRDGILDDDRMVHLNVTSRALLPKELSLLVTPGKKVKVMMECSYEIKDIDDPCDEIADRIIYTENMNEPFKILRCTDRLLFAVNGTCEIHERLGVIYSAIDNPDNPIKEEYINEYGHIIHHPENKNAKDCYTILGKAGDVITPKLLGDYYLTVEEPETDLELFLSLAMKQGLKIAEPPASNDIELVLDVHEDGNATLECRNAFYGFDKPVLIDMDERDVTKRRLIHIFTAGLIAYRWLFKRPDLTFTLKLSDTSCPITTEIQEILDFVLITKVAQKWERRVYRGASYKPTKDSL